MADISVTAQQDASAALYKKVAWRIMPYLMLIYVVAFIDRTNIGVAQLTFIKDLGFNVGIYGAAAGLFYLGYALLEIPSNMALLKFGARKTLLTIMILWGVACMALALITTPASFYFVRFLLGAAEAGLFPGILLYLTYWIPAKRRARFTAWFMMAIPLSGLIGSPLAGWIMHSLSGVSGLRGWQWLFIIEGAPAVLLGIVTYFYLDNGPRDATWLDDSERAALLSDLAGDAPREAKHGAVMTVLFNPVLYVLAVFGTSLLISTNSAFLWVPAIIRDSGVKDVLTISLLTAIPFGFGIVVQFLVSKSSDRSGERRWHAAVPALFGAIGWAALSLAGKNTGLSMACLTVAIAGTLGAMGPFWTLPGLLLRGPAVAVGIALVSTIAGLGNFWSPNVVAYLTNLTGNLAAGQQFFAVLMLIGVALLAIGTKRSQFEHKAQET